MMACLSMAFEQTYNGEMEIGCSTLISLEWVLTTFRCGLTQAVFPLFPVLA